MALTIQQLIRRERSEYNQRVAVYNGHLSELRQLEAKHRLSEEDTRRVDELRPVIARLSEEADRINERITALEADAGEEARLLEASNTIASSYTIGGRGGETTVSVGVDRSVGRASLAGNPGDFLRTHDQRLATVARGQRFADHAVAAEEIGRMSARDQAIIGQHGSLGQLVRAMSTSSGSAIVPSVWAANVIDRARNLSAVMRAGAQLVPMDAKVVQVGRLTADPTAAFRAENSEITASDPSFDNVTLTATSLNALVVGSMEWFADAQNADQLVENAIAQAMATQIDLVALYGQITSGAGSINLPSPNPKGILATLVASASSSVLGGATDGTTQTAASFYNELLDTLFTPKDFNETPGAMIWNSKLARMYAKAYDSTYQPLRMPQDLADVQRFVSNQIPSYTKGAMTGVATDVFCGDFTQLLIGQRLDVQIQVLTERYAEFGQIGIVATWRGDIGVARPRAFSVYKALKGA